MDAFFDLFTPLKGRSDVNTGAQTLNSDPQTIVSHWRRLLSRDSITHQQIATLVDDERNRNIALKFKGEDAATVINVIDKVLKENRIPDGTKSHAFRMLRKLAGTSRQVPKSYLVGWFTRYKVRHEVIANGGSADIREGRLGGMVVAVKTIRISREMMPEIDTIHKAFCKECVLWMNISHPNILKLIAVKIKPKTGKFSMISEMMTNGNILNYISSNKANRLCLLEDVTKGLEHLHESGIIHGDLKGPNILINNKTPPRACISDFGLGSIAPSLTINLTTCRQGPSGTFGYMGPELFSEGAMPSKEADMYAFGMVIYEVVTGARPFGKRRMQELLPLTGGVRPNKPEDPVAIGFGQGTWEFAERCWDENPERRPTAREALEHFEHVAKTSTVIDPGSTIRSDEVTSESTSRLESTFIDYAKLLAHPSTAGPSRLQQPAIAARVLVSNQNVRIPFLPANGEHNLLGRMRRGIGSLRPAPRLAAPPQDDGS